MELGVGCWNLLLHCSVLVLQIEVEGVEGLSAAAAVVVALLPVEESV